MSPPKPLLLGKAAKQKHPDDVKDDDRNDPGQDRLNDPAGGRAIDHDLMTGKLFSQLRIDADGEELALAARQRLLQRALNRIRADRDLGDLALIEQCLELAIRNGLDLRVAGPELLEQQNAEHGGHHVPDHELALASIRFHIYAAFLHGWRPMKERQRDGTVPRPTQADIDMAQNLKRLFCPLPRLRTVREKSGTHLHDSFPMRSVGFALGHTAVRGFNSSVTFAQHRAGHRIWAERRTALEAHVMS